MNDSSGCGRAGRRQLLAALSAAVAGGGCARVSNDAHPVSTDDKYLAGFQPGKPWRMPRNGPGNAGVNRPSAVASDDVGLGWKRDVRGGPTRLVAGERRLFVATQSGTVVALAGRDGSDEWNWTPPDSERAYLTGLAYDDGLLFVAWTPEDDQRGLGVVALDAASGQVVWRITDEGSANDLRVHDGTLYVAVSDPEGVLTVAADAGTTRWRRQLAGSVGAVAVAADTVVTTVRVDAGVDALVALDAGDGSERWRHRSDRFLEMPVAVDKTVFTVEHRHGLTAHSLVDGRKRWSVAAPSVPRFQTVPAVGSGRVFAAGARGDGPGDDEMLVALDAGDGTRDWTAALDHPMERLPFVRTTYVSGSPSPMVAGGTVVVPSTANEPFIRGYALDGTRQFDLHVPWLDDEAPGLAAPILGLSVAPAHGLLYVAVAGDDRVYAAGGSP